MPDPDRVGADDAGVDEVVRTGAVGRVQAGDEVLDGAELRVGVVVLELHQPDDVGVELADGGDDLVPLAVELERRVGTAGGREAAAGAVAVEVVEHVERRHLHVTADVLGGAGRGLVWLNSIGPTGCTR